MKATFHKATLAISIGTIWAGTSSVNGQSNEELKALIRELDQKVRVLEHKLEGQDGGGEKSKTTPLVSIGPEGFIARSADTNFVLRLGFHLQADGRFYPNEAPSAVTDTFLMRKVRPIIDGTVYGKFDYRLMMDFGSGLNATAANVGFLQEAYINARLWPEFQIQAGKFKEPVGLERLQSDINVGFIERGFPTQLVPNRDVGIQLQGDILQGTVTYAAGVFNGVADAGSGDIETTDDAKDVAARIFSQPFKHIDFRFVKGLGLGVAGTYGNPQGALPSFVSPGQQRFFTYRSGVGTNAATANILADGQHWRLAPQANYYVGPFGILAEYVISDQKVRRDAGGSTFAQIKNTAWQVEASYILTGEANTFNKLVPTRPLTLGGEGWGAWEVLARVGELDVDQKAFPLFANPANAANAAISWGLGINWHLNRNVKLSADYEQTHFRGGTSPLAQSGEKVVLTRAQLSF